MKKHMTIVTLLFMLFTTFFINNVNAQKKVVIDVYYSESCQACHKLIGELDKLKNKYTNLFYTTYEVSQDQGNHTLMRDVAQELGVEITGVPFTVVNGESYTGYAPELMDKIHNLLSTDGEEIEYKNFFEKMKAKYNNMSISQRRTIIVGSVLGVAAIAGFVIFTSKKKK